MIRSHHAARAFFSGVLFLASFASSAVAQPTGAHGAALLGRYGGVISGPSLGDVYVILTLDRDATNEIRGNVSLGSGAISLTDVVISGETMTATLQYSGTPVALHLTLEQNRLHGRYQAGPEVGVILLRRMLPGESNGPVLRDLSAADWDADFEYFAQQLPLRHANLFHLISRSQFQAEVAAMELLPSSATPTGAVTGLGRITADVGDAHTRVVTPPSFHRYPLQVFWFGNHLRVVAAEPSLSMILGDEVIAINGVSIGRIRQAADTLVSKGETAWYELDRTPVYMMSAERLQAFGFIKDASSPVDFKVRNDKFLRIIRVTPIAITKEVQFAQLGGTEYAKRAEASFASIYLPAENLVYAVFNSYDNLPSAAANFFSLVDSHPSARILIDMRENGGGDFLVGRSALVEPLSKRIVSKSRRLYVAIGRATFSAGVTNAVDLKKIGAVLLGEPAGERPNGYQESRDMLLPNSGITITYSTKSYTNVSDSDNILKPDVEIDPSFQLLRQHADPILNWFQRHRDSYVEFERQQTRTQPSV